MFDNGRRKNGFFTMFLTSLLTSLGVGILLIFAVTGFVTGNRSTAPQTPQGGSGIEMPSPQQISAEQSNNTGGQNTIQSVAENASKAVVGISVLKVDSSSIFNPNAVERWGVGSGVIVTPNGYILTNHHVAGGKSKRIVVSLVDGKNLDGVTVWSDSVLDLAVVKIEAEGLPTIPLGDATKLKVGEPAIAIGNPLGLQFQRTVTSGIISALNRTIEVDTEQGTNYMEGLIQTDASINPGNSGGPLLNLKGEVVGINTVKVASAEGIGFAVPINVAIPIINKFATTGEFIEPYLGVFAYDKDIIPYLDGNVKVQNGVYVANVDENGPAYKSGIRVGCIMTQIDGEEISTMMQLRCVIYSKNPGDVVTIRHISNGKPQTVQVRLAAKEKDGLVTR
ncbi:S1-C subfamily serine protease [Acetivibrio thermocellus AD2]|jgi:serine protease Do|uniref:S1-C subfamily serine protease n=1 Tax=Acetivibrio thermocellus AD2 TaxID=1138384 RepID=A0AB36TCP1_ACETH|nr:trypsin-like peptidase domain-containing protein [Acetivibrio thermocellus]CDG36988.1 peptidase S1 and S6 chymotrypsin/Hap [Acetivibrio thermocellus BC1]ADU73193.1 peptidase S1 and S6 chymotrypsin/Hap [Acetivibrio thermocellus DSM 1313]ALX07108.1 PDZ/DHR/GLGF domain protein [Acetivibrio thermocellus AD2]ANV74844.1 PDZ/DHR/GLGF domain protein [Acetivibrio thermocellus DSM 2360]EIC03972.1 peptidase S1 and S6 chymotrypsin/Hap [Acetivibrio thermocellus YS]